MWLAVKVEEFREAESALHDDIGIEVVVIGGEVLELVVKDFTESYLGVQLSPEALAFGIAVFADVAAIIWIGEWVGVLC